MSISQRIQVTQVHCENPSNPSALWVFLRESKCRSRWELAGESRVDGQFNNFQMQRFGFCPFFKRSRDPPSKLAGQYSKREWRISTLLKDHHPPTTPSQMSSIRSVLCLQLHKCYFWYSAKDRLLFKGKSSWKFLSRKDPPVLPKGLCIGNWL